MSDERQRREGAKPGYPTRLEAMNDADLLAGSLPAKWQRLLAAGGIAALFLCAPVGDAAAADPAPAAQEKAEGGDRPARVIPNTAVVAPIFEHGEGRAATGCVVVSPPVFMTEEEALQIIQEELAKAGLKPGQKDVELPGVQVAPGGMEREDGDADANRPGQLNREKAAPLRIDLRDEGRHVAVEFISREEYHKLGGPMSMSTVQSYDMKKVAANVAEAMGAGPGGYYGVFYDPTIKLDNRRLTDEIARLNKDGVERTQAYQRAWEAIRREHVEKSREELRAQVRDFVEWLGKRGAI